jgi:error-prone DNA polymerase
LKCHHPDVFCAALLNAQPMGFYAPAQIVRDAESHGVVIRPVCINASSWDCDLEQNAVRLGFRMVRGLAADHADAMVAARARPYRSIPDLHRRARVPVAALERLAEADAFHSLNLPRRQAVWAIRGLSDNRLPLFDHADDEANEPAVDLPAMTEGRQVVEDYRSVGLSLRDHPVSFLRVTLEQRRIVRCADLAQRRDGSRLTVAGIVLVRQRPGSARGVLFVTIEDETGHANLIVWPSVFEINRRLLLSATMLACRGKLQKESGVIHVIADQITDLSGLLRGVGDETRAMRVPTRDFR